MTVETGKYVPHSLPDWSVPMLGSLAEHDRTTYLHSVRVGMMSYILWSAIKVRQPGETEFVTSKDMFVAGTLHDIWKTDISGATLQKHAALSEEEMEEVGRHPFEGAAEVAPYDTKIADIIRGHHRFGKNGVIYPSYEDDPAAQEARGRPGYHEVEMAQRVLAVADKADAGINRINGIHGSTAVDERAEMEKRFESELSTGSIRPEWITAALDLAWEAGSVYSR